MEGMVSIIVHLHFAQRRDRAYTYVIYSSIESLYRLNTTDNENFYVGNNENKEMLMPRQQRGIVISIGYKDENPAIVTKAFETGTDSTLTVSLLASTEEDVKALLWRYDKFPKANRISVDLEEMKKFFIEEERQRKLTKESEFIRQLWCVANRCCCHVELEM